MEIISYEDLIISKSNSGEYVKYVDKLNTAEWLSKRLEILERDKNQCEKCFQSTEMVAGKTFRTLNSQEKEEHWQKTKKDLEEIIGDSGTVKLSFITKESIAYPLMPVELNVHHQYYIQNKLPWEYPNNALITLCKECHTNVHKTEYIPVFSDYLKLEKLNLSTCNTCDGSGYRSEYHYYQNGICFTCDGTGFIGIV